MGVLLSKKHGVNPAIPLCFYCNEPKNEIILAGRLPGDAEAPRNMAWDKVPCDKCQEWMKQGIIMISVKADSDRENPYRTGGWVVLKDEAFDRVFNAPEAKKARICFVPDEVWDAVGLPRGEVNNAE